MCEIPWEPLNGFATNSQGKRVWSLDPLDEFEGQGQRSNVNVTRNKNGIFVPFGGLHAVYVW